MGIIMKMTISVNKAKTKRKTLPTLKTQEEVLLNLNTKIPNKKKPYQEETPYRTEPDPPN